MLVLKLERWPQGNERRKESLGTLTLANDMRGTEEVGSYEVTLKLPTGDPHHTHITGARGSSPVHSWVLVGRAIMRLMGSV
jgi:hypothetical protein